MAAHGFHAAHNKISLSPPPPELSYSRGVVIAPRSPGVCLGLFFFFFGPFFFFIVLAPSASRARPLRRLFPVERVANGAAHNRCERCGGDRLVFEYYCLFYFYFILLLNKCFIFRLINNIYASFRTIESNQFGGETARFVRTKHAADGLFLPVGASLADCI